MERRRIRRIVAALWTGNASGRDLLSGILEYVHEYPSWNLTILQLPNEDNQLIDAIIASGVDGVITSDTLDPNVSRIITETGAAAVTLAPQQVSLPNAGKIDCLTKHNYLIGRLGGEYFLSAGHFNSYGFVRGLALGRNKSPSAPEERERGFSDAIAAAGFKCNSFLSFYARQTGTDSERLHKWLGLLPKPAAVMCFYDPFAVHVIYACSHLGFSIPSQVSVLGVDNDTILCETVCPMLSSIDPDHRRIGHQMARHLNALLCNRRLKEIPPRYSTDQIIVRTSTKILSPSANLVRNALKFIAEHAADGIGVDDVVKHLRVSRRLIFLRFREVENRTIHQAIEDRRLEIAVQRLKSTKWPIKRIAAACGYSSLQAFGAAFRKRFSRTPRTFRESH